MWIRSASTSSASISICTQDPVSCFKVTARRDRTRSDCLTCGFNRSSAGRAGTQLSLPNQVAQKRFVTMASTSDSTEPSTRVVICGGGIIGASPAYYLTQMGVKPLVVERTAVGCAASGKAGGFLALNWNDGTSSAALARKSYQLHKELAESLGVDVGYRAVDTLQVKASELAPKSGRSKRVDKASLPLWVDGNLQEAGVLATTTTTAQVHPFKLTNALMDAAIAKGAELKTGAVQGIDLSPGPNPAVQGVIVDGSTIPADVVVIAMGPWSGAASRWLPIPKITGQKYHSVVFRPNEPFTAHCLFTNFRTAQGEVKEPEVYPRPDGTVYMCGEPEMSPVPESADQVTVQEELCKRIQRMGASMCSALGEAEVEVQQACYLPLSPKGPPVIGRVPGVAGAFVGTGHSCWGILNGPATGLALAELITTGKSSSVDISGLTL